MPIRPETAAAPARTSTGLPLDRVPASRSTTVTGPPCLASEKAAVGPALPPPQTSTLRSLIGPIKHQAPGTLNTKMGLLRRARLSCHLINRRHIPGHTSLDTGRCRTGQAHLGPVRQSSRSRPPQHRRGLRAAGTVETPLIGDYMVTYNEGMDDDDTVFKALADPTRRRLLDQLFERDGRALGELDTDVEMTRFGVMKHIKVLHDAGLVTSRKVGRERLIFLNPVPIQMIHDRWINKYTERRASALTELKAQLEDGQ